MKKVLLQALLLFLCGTVWAQTRTITGKVMANHDADPLVGATVQIKGTTTAASTDINGNFKLNIPTTGVATLLVKFIGYKPQEIPITTQTSFEIKLMENEAMLNEVAIVNIGYTSVSKEKLAGAVSSVSEKDLKDYPVSTVAEALAGKLAGVSVKTTEGAPGAAITITVRGGTSLSQDNSPLYVVDGVPLDNALSILSPDEIQSIDVLKDVASTSIYGARGANGVVLITTKSGKKGRTVVNFTSYAGVRKITNEIPVLNPYDFVKYQYELTHLHYNGYQITDTATVNGFTNSYGPYNDLDIYKSFPDVDWQHQVFGRTAFSNTQAVNISGGSETATYNATLNNYDEQGIMLNSGLQRTFGSFRFDNKISDQFRIGLNVRYSRQLVNGQGTSNTGSSSSNSLKNAVRFQPYNGLINVESFDPTSVYDSQINLSNPISSAQIAVQNAYQNTLFTTGTIGWSITKALTLNSVIGYTASDNKTNQFNGLTNYAVSGSTYANQPYINLSTSSNVNVDNSNTLSFNPKLSANHTLNILMGEEINQNNATGFNQTIKYFPTAVTADQAFANVQQANPPSGDIQSAPTSSVSGDRILSFFGRAMYSYKNKYNLNLSIRRDGSSKFAPDHQWGTFPSAQFAWRATEEDFMKKLDWTWLSNLKLRASYGTAGNNRVSSDRLYATTFTTSATTAGYSTTDASQTAGIYSANLANPNLQWETTIARDLGLDFDVFGSRLTASIDVYLNQTKNLLLLANIPQQTGYVQQYQNVGETQNKGLEVQLTGVVVTSSNFSYTNSFNISFNKNTIKALQGGIQSYTTSSGWGATGDDFLVQVGRPVGQYYGYVTDGFYTLNDFDRSKSNPATGVWVLKPGEADASTILNQKVIPGVIKLKKISTGGDSTITSNDRTALGNSQPLFYGGFNNSFTYKNFDLTIFVNFSVGNKTYNANSIEFSSAYKATGNNVLAKFANRWQPFDNNGNLISNWDQLAAVNANAKTYDPTRGPYILTSDAIQDASFLRVSNVTFGYTLPKKLMQRTHVISNLRIYATVNNLYTFTKYAGFDPEASTRGSNPLTPGVDYSAYPRSRYILAGLNLTF